MARWAVLCANDALVARECSSIYYLKSHHVVAVLPRRKRETQQSGIQDIAAHPSSLLLHHEASSTVHTTAEALELHTSYTGTLACKVAGSFPRLYSQLLHITY